MTQVITQHSSLTIIKGPCLSSARYFVGNIQLEGYVS